MRAYADSSFIVRLVTPKAGSDEAVDEYRRFRSPALFFLPLHMLEVRNAILQRAFHQRHSIASDERRRVRQERDAALSRLERFVARRALLEVAIDMETAIAGAVRLSNDHSENVGTRAIDLLHVSSALILESELFLTTDGRQAQLAKAEGLKVVSVNPD